MRIYTAAISLSVPATADVDIWSIVGTSAIRVKLLEFELMSTDIAAELIELRLRRISASGSGGGTFTAKEPTDPLGAASVAVVHTLDTTAGALVNNLRHYAWEQLGPIGKVWTPETIMGSQVSAGFALTTTSAVAFSARGAVTWQEA